LGLPPTGKAVSFAGNDIYRMVEGRIAKEWAQFDAPDLLQ
jgi:predicted ester cyclase